MPSYKLLNKLCERWQQTGLWDEIGNKKVIIAEPRFSDEFESSIRHFNEVIETTSEPTYDGVDGALMIAVCRGKVSEGRVVFILDCLISVPGRLFISRKIPIEKSPFAFKI